MGCFWQIAAGSSGRDYAHFFLKYGIAFAGGNTQISKMSEVKAGDIVAIKNGTKQILAAGKIITRDDCHNGCGDKKWLRGFDGWDLPAYCYVEWYVPSKPVTTTGLTRATIQKIHQVKHKELVNKILATGELNTPLPEPMDTLPVEDERFLKFLIREGLRPASADELTQTMEKIRLLADYYYHNCYSEDIREHETRTFLVIPLLIALGWAEQQIKIELSCSEGRIDIACFQKSYRRNNNECLAIIETKGFSSGLDYAPKQARAYSKDFPKCKAVIVTNGYCYKVYLRDSKNEFSTVPSAYLNILNPTERYPLEPEKVGGALEAIKWLLPNSLS
ncbi:hypothetical protein CTM88_19320 [Photobacterium aquimaris]|uniref:Uncharacterized protein n=1 Tax=Photobacterium aquimaris TaxID=512643 RepID=A0A2T3IFA7_9GAMM|nr:type I restriction enzyme HsdR N-terminal domain-containing protein [Photobacterium aquimaris]OBU22087.1 hypothetical protein AYY20_12925 [Photobacterium aquimaris]PSU24128.1 hypothetical protein CTM88_19320 [Photobacterium aquimaris]